MAKGNCRFSSLVRRQSHADSVARRVEKRLSEHYRDAQTVASAVEASGIPERTLKRRFKAATGTTLIAHVQNLRIGEAKRMLDPMTMSADEISAMVGYENPVFFRRLFKRCTRLTPGAYRRMFRPVAEAGVKTPVA